MPVQDLPQEQSDSPNPEPDADGRSHLALGYMWATVIMTMALEMVLPIVLGLYVDCKLGTKCLFLILGIFFGFCAMIVNYFKLMKLKDFPHSPDTKK